MILGCILYIHNIFDYEKNSATQGLSGILTDFHQIHRPVWPRQANTSSYR